MREIRREKVSEFKRLPVRYSEDKYRGRDGNYFEKQMLEEDEMTILVMIKRKT